MNIGTNSTTTHIGTNNTNIHSNNNNNINNNQNSNNTHSHQHHSSFSSTSSVSLHTTTGSISEAVTTPAPTHSVLSIASLPPPPPAPITNNNSNASNNNTGATNAPTQVTLLESMSNTIDKSSIKDHLKKHSLSLKNSRDQTLIHMAAMNGNQEVIRQCLKKKYVNLDEVKPLALKDKDGYTPILCAISEGHLDIAEKLLSKNSDPNATTASGSSSLHLLPRQHNNPKANRLATQLIEAGAYINHKDSRFETPLHRATLQCINNFDLIKIFLEHGANPNIYNKRGKTCLHLAIENKRVDLLELFLEYGAIFTKTSSNFQSPLEFAKQSDDLNIIKFFNERIAACGEYILTSETSNCFIGNNQLSYYHNGDQFLSTHSTQLVSGHIYITNYRIVFRAEHSTSQTNTDTFSIGWPFGENEEMMIPLMSIDNITTDNNTSGQQAGSSSSNSNSSYQTTPTITPSNSAFNINPSSLMPPTASSTPGSVTPTNGQTPTSSFLIPNSINPTSITSISFLKHKEKEKDKDRETQGDGSTYFTITITSKDYRHNKLYFSNQALRDRILDTIVFHSRTKVERILKHIDTNRQLQLKIAHDNMDIGDVDNDMIGNANVFMKFEYYGIFEDPLPYLFAHVYKSLPTPPEDGWQVYSLKREYARFGITEDNNNSKWRITTINKDFKMCSSYPPALVVSKTLHDLQLERVFGYRSKGRIPVLSWRSPTIGAAILRCSQPLVGISSARCTEDELYISDLASRFTNVYLLDARPKLNAIANTANGAGFENITNYPNCKLVFLNIANIHVMRKSLERLVSTLSPWAAGDSDSKYMTLVEESGWLSHVRQCLAGGVYAAELIQKGINVVVHCSDGWDRTPQLTSLAQLILDPYYRTIIGLEVLIEKEWVSYGHKFALRLGHLQESDEEQSPIFIQFLDSIFQLVNQFPVLFEYTPALLLFIAEHLYSCKYGTFLLNCEKERLDHETKAKTVSIWTDVNRNLPYFTNPFYQSHQDGVILRPNLNLRAIELWRALYQRSDSQNTYIHNQWMMQSHYQLKSTFTNCNNINNNNINNNIENINIDNDNNEILNNTSQSPMTSSASTPSSTSLSPEFPPEFSLSSNGNSLPRISNVVRRNTRHRKSHSSNTQIDMKANDFYGTINSSMLSKSESVGTNTSSPNPGILFVKSNELTVKNQQLKHNFLASHRPASKDPSPKTSFSSMDILAQSLPTIKRSDANFY